MANEMKFQINDEIVTLSSLDDNTYLKLLSDSNYVIDKLNELVANGMLDINGTIKTIIRFIDDIQETILEDNTKTTTETEIAISREWGTQETRLLLDKYEIYLPNIGPQKRFKTKKHMWKQIAEDIENILNIKRTDIQCENRYKTIMKRKKKAIDNNRTSGSSRQNVPFENEIRKICCIDDSIEPAVLKGVGDKIIIKENNSKQSELDETPKNKTEVKYCRNTTRNLQRKRGE